MWALPIFHKKLNKYWLFTSNFDSNFLLSAAFVYLLLGSTGWAAIKSSYRKFTNLCYKCANQMCLRVQQQQYNAHQKCCCCVWQHPPLQMSHLSKSVYINILIYLKYIERSDKKIACAASISAGCSQLTNKSRKRWHFKINSKRVSFLCSQLTINYGTRDENCLLL